MQILCLKIRKLSKDLFRRQASSEEINDIADADAHAAHTRSAAALFGIDGDPFDDLVHAPSLPTCATT